MGFFSPMLILLLCLCLIPYVCIYVIITVCSCCTLCLSLVNKILNLESKYRYHSGSPGCALSSQRHLKLCLSNFLTLTVPKDVFLCQTPVVNTTLDIYAFNIKILSCDITFCDSLTLASTKYNFLIFYCYFGQKMLFKSNHIYFIGPIEKKSKLVLNLI